MTGEPLRRRCQECIAEALSLAAEAEWTTGEEAAFKLDQAAMMVEVAYLHDGVEDEL